MYDRPTPSPTPTEPAAEPKRNRRALGCLLELIETVVLTLVLFFVIQTFVAQPFQVQQFSMQNTIQDGQYVLVDRLTPRFDGYHRGDIIVFTPPISIDESPDRKPFIKRVIGIPGDTIELRDGQVWVNGVALVEPYIYSVGGAAQPSLPEGGGSSWKIETGFLFVMGDHRQRSTDSRQFGPIAIDAVIGRAWLRYWPLNDLEVLPTAKHPELATPSPSAGPSPDGSAPPSAKPSAKPTPKPTKRPTPTPKH